MKKIFFAAFVAVTCFCTACNNDSDSTAGNKYTQEEQMNIAASDVIMKAFQTGDVSGIDSVVSDDFIDHTDRGDMKGRDSLKAMVNWVHANMKDMKTEKVREVADGDFVYSWMRYTGTSDGTMGMPNGPYDMQAIEVARYRDGKAIEHWNFAEIQAMMKMMPQPTMNNMDTTKMNN
jgi:predicted SnoaL-like aldol condensation-catalyzing enzyme